MDTEVEGWGGWREIEIEYERARQLKRAGCVFV